MYYPPPPGSMWFSFMAGVIWGGCSWGWGHTDVDIDINRYNNFVDNTEIGDRRQEVKDRASVLSQEFVVTFRRPPPRGVVAPPYWC